MSVTAERIAAKEAELAQARESARANYGRFAGCSKLRGKQHQIRGDAQLRRGAQLGETVRRLERELAALREQPTAADPVDAASLVGAKFVLTRWGWHQVVKVNKATVKVLAAPGMDDRVPVSKILEVRP